MADYISRHTGEEIDACVDRIQDLNTIEENLNSQNNLINTIEEALNLQNNLINTMDEKLDTIEEGANLYAPTGAITSVETQNLTASMALISNSSGKIAASSVVSATELEYLEGATSNIQVQLNNKAPAYTYSTTDLTAGTSELATGELYFVYE